MLRELRICEYAALVLRLRVGKQIFVGTAAAAAAADGRGGSGCTCAGNSRCVVAYQDNTIIHKEEHDEL